MRIFITILITILFATLGFNLNAQDHRIYQTKPIVDIRGDETPDHSNIEIVETTVSPQFGPVYTSEFTFEVHNITDRKTGYDLQSNASTQQVWVDYNNPQYIHAIFTNSQQSSGYADRTCLYFGSTDGGVTWLQFGGVPVNTGIDGHSGFPSIYGLPGGEAVILNHNNSNSSTYIHTKLYFDNSPLEYNFSEYDPGNINDGPVWPRHVVTDENIVIFASSGSEPSPTDVKINTFDLSTGLFSGWQNLASDDAEQYDFAISPNGTIGLAYNGWDEVNQDGDVLYRFSTDNGLNWSDSVKIYDSDNQFIGDTAYGALRGISVNFYNEEPCVTYEISQQTFSANGSYFPGLPSEIHFWSPNINGGVPKVIADSNNVPYHPYVGTPDVHVPVCRPVIGRADNGYLFIAFNATTEHVFISPDTTSYMAGYFTYSSDGGENWSTPEKFTPDGPPLLDWRYPSIAEVIPVTVTDGEAFTIHIVMQGDTLPGSTVNTEGMPVGVTAQYYHFSADVTIGSADGNEGVITTYTLEQNYPNPFNPSTKIKYTIPAESFVQLKVYDVLGNEVATLVNEEKSAGTYKAEFNSHSGEVRNLPSGVYFYTLNAGSFSETKKMILMK